MPEETYIQDLQKRVEKLEDDVRVVQILILSNTLSQELSRVAGKWFLNRKEKEVVDRAKVYAQKILKRYDGSFPGEVGGTIRKLGDIIRALKKIS